MDAQANFAESHLSIGRLVAAEPLFKHLLNNTALQTEYKLFLRVELIAILLAQNKINSTLNQLDRVHQQVQSLAGDYQTSWNYSGVKHAIKTNPAFNQWPWLVDFFNGFEGSQADMLKAIDTARQHLKNTHTRSQVSLGNAYSEAPASSQLTSF